MGFMTRPYSQVAHGTEMPVAGPVRLRRQSSSGHRGNYDDCGIVASCGGIPHTEVRVGLRYGAVRVYGDCGISSTKRHARDAGRRRQGQGECVAVGCDVRV